MKKIFIACLILSLISTAGIAKDWERIRFATEGAYAPFNTIDKDGNPAGLEVEWVNAICKEIKRQCTIQTQDWDGIIPALIAKKYDVIAASLSITEERKKTVAFSLPYYTTPNNFVAKKGAFKSVDASDLSGKKIGVQKATISENFIRDNYKNSQISSYTTIEEAFLDLTAGRVDLVFNDSLNTQEAFLAKPEGKGYAFVGPDFSGGKWFGDGVGFAFRKSDQDLKKILDDAILKLYADGTFNKIARKYFPDTDISIKR